MLVHDTLEFQQLELILNRAWPLPSRTCFVKTVQLPFQHKTAGRCPKTVDRAAPMEKELPSKKKKEKSHIEKKKKKEDYFSA